MFTTPDDFSKDAAQLGEQCLNYLIGNPEELARFMEYAGLSPNALRAGLGSPDLARGMFDYVVHNESVLLAMCANAGLNAANVMRVWQRMNPQA